MPQIAFKAIKSNFYKLEELHLEIPFEKMLILENFRNEAILNETLPSTDKIPKIKTKIVHNNKEFNAEIRLKGDRKPHFVDKEKSSYKVELNKNQYIFGIKKFSLQKPRIRNYIHEWIFHELSGDQGIIKLKYDFINLSINGDDKGLYVVEEGFGKELIERNKRRNSPIFSLNEDINTGHKKPVFEIYNKKYWEKPENIGVANVASQKLHDFFSKNLNVEEVFDLEKWAAYFAVIDLTTTFHGALFKSVRFYYNPLNGLFEPIPFDGHKLRPNFNKYNINYDNRILIDIINDSSKADIQKFEWIRKFFYKENRLNKEFYKIYSTYLHKISSKKYIDSFLLKNSKKIDKINSHIYADYFFYDSSRAGYGPGIYYFLNSDLKYLAQRIREKLKFDDKIQLLKIDQNNYVFRPFYKNYGQIIADEISCIKDNKQVNFKLNQYLNNFTNTNLSLGNENTKGLDCNSVALIDKLSKEKIFLKIDYLNSEYSYENFKKINFESFKEFFAKKENKLFLKKDDIEINKDIYIPSGYEVIIHPGQKLFLSNQAFIFSNSPWHIGGKNQTVIISGKKNDLGGGIFIGDTKKLSKIENTKFSYLNGYDLNRNYEYIIMGSINFHQTQVEIKDVIFENIFSEDAINIFRSDFDIHDVSFANVSSDAIDVDFSDGNIMKANFIDIKNDAIDFSGSNVNIDNIYFDNINDKIISAGEDSNININQAKGINSYAGIISKDGSKVISKNIYFDGVKIPFAAYNKKNEYKYPQLEAKNYIIKNYLTKSIKDTTAKLISEDETLVMKSNKIISLMYEKNISLIE